ncbi:MAG: TolC family protein, partial [Lentisphaeria bacterium]
LGAASRDNVEFEDNERSGSLGLVATWDLYTGGAKQAAVDTAAADYEIAARQLQDRWQAIVGEIRRQLPIINAARRRLKLNRESASLALQIRDDIEQGWRAGTEPLTRLNETQRDLNVAKLNLAVVRTELLQARSDLDTATGSILD